VVSPKLQEEEFVVVAIVVVQQLVVFFLHFDYWMKWKQEQGMVVTLLLPPTPTVLF
jgi:hypothetical protein